MRRQRSRTAGVDCTKGRIIESSMRRWPYQPCCNERATFIAQRCKKKQRTTVLSTSQAADIILKPQCKVCGRRRAWLLCSNPGDTKTIARQGTLEDKESTLLNRQDAIFACLQATADREKTGSQAPPSQGPGRAAPHGLISDDRNPQTARVRCEAFVHRSSGREATSGYWLVIEELGSCRPSLNLRRPRTRRHSRGIALFCRPFVRVQRYGPLRRLHYHNLLLLLVFHLLAPRASVLSPCVPLYTW